MKELFGDMGMKTVNGDEAFYYKSKDGKLEGMILRHVDDFNMAGTEEVIENVEIKTFSVKGGKE